MPVPLSALLRHVGARAMCLGAMRETALRVAAARGRSMVLLYHRISPTGAAAHEIVSNVASSLLRAQLEALRAEVDIVPLAQLLNRDVRSRRVRVAITFDDDEAGHAEHALPVLRDLGVPATFFLSGRALHGLGPYWWMTLERLIREKGTDTVAGTLATHAASPCDLAAACEGTPLAERLARMARADDGAMLGSRGIRALADAGMTIGFHTIEHPVLVTLDDGALGDALRDGVATLVGHAGVPVELLAYPHGKANARVACAASAAGFRAAFRSGKRPIHPGSDPFLLGRWEPGVLDPDALLAELAMRVNHPGVGPRRSTPTASDSIADA